ncbi:MAG: hypothetical protein IPM17_06765 [Verrucomicrobia bacterium]|nr:hypothetical protein [Verrucomicrobiota bacterium]
MSVVGFTRALWLAALVAVAAPKASAGSPATVFTFDARPLREVNLAEPSAARRVWDTLHLLAALQGLANRDAPRLYLFYCREFGVDTDQFWFDWLRGEDGWLRDAEIEAVGEVETLLGRLRDAFDGLVVYDERVAATSKAASTAAGCERLLPVRYDQATNALFLRLTRDLALPVKLWLVNADGSSRFTGQGRLPDSDLPSSGSAKVDVYRWAMSRWLRPATAPAERRSSLYGAYYLDAYWLQRPRNAGPDHHTLSNHDWFIARRAFFFDLSPWGDEAPVDDPAQPLGADKACLLDILRGLYDRSGGGIVKLGGFPPWPHKYTTHARAGKHEPVPTEWEFTRLISQFNAYKEADAAGLGAMANASFFAHYPLKEHYRQPNPKPGLPDWKARGFVAADGKVAARFFVGHYVGDYDAPSWLYKAVPAFFRDPARGRVPLGWAFNPNLADRAPQALVYASRHATTNDFFIAGNSGAGYLNSRALTVRPDSRLPSGLAAWTEYCRRHFARWDLTITGFMLDGSAGAATETEFAAYRSFSPDGIGTHFERGPRIRAGIPTCPERDLPDSVGAAASVIAERARESNGRPGFLWARSILKSPTWYADVSERLRQDHPDLPIEIVDPYTFFGLIALEYAAGTDR